MSSISSTPYLRQLASKRLGRLHIQVLFWSNENQSTVSPEELQGLLKEQEIQIETANRASESATVFGPFLDRNPGDGDIRRIANDVVERGCGGGEEIAFFKSYRGVASKPPTRFS